MKNTVLDDGKLSMTLSKQGYYMPAQWEKHRATWIAWPHNHNDWPGKFAAIPMVYAEFVRLLKDETVNILAQDKQEMNRARTILENAHVEMSHVQFYTCENNRSWVRDSGPTFVKNSNRRKIAVLWKFNAWAKYDNFQKDQCIGKKIAEYAGVQIHPITYMDKPIVLEGGAIDVDGNFLLMSTEECLLSKKQERNPGLTKKDYEKIFRDNLGIERVIWLEKGIIGDDTHGHIDDIARFVQRNTVVAAIEYNCSDVNYLPLNRNLEILKEASVNVIEIPMPKPLYFKGFRLPASYLNFYIGNEVVLVPTFNDPNDRIALKVIEGLFPSREVIGIHAVDLVWGFGTFDCMTQQEPTD